MSRKNFDQNKLAHSLKNLILVEKVSRGKE